MSSEPSNWKSELPVNLAMAVEKFQLAAGDSVGVLDVRQLGRYTGMQCEELAEKLCLIGGLSGVAGEQVLRFSELLDSMGKMFKSGALDELLNSVVVNDDNRALMVDADIDLAWVSFGSLNSQACNVDACCAEVAKANLDKIGPDGVVLRDTNGKIQKPAGWTEPDHLPHLYPLGFAAGGPVTEAAKARVSGFAELR